MGVKRVAQALHDDVDEDDVVCNVCGEHDVCICDD